MHKNERQNEILSIIRSERVTRQDRLVELLQGRGFDVTQASVSRDLVSLGIVKLNGQYTIPGSAKISGIGTVDIALAGDNLIVVKSESGLASAIAVRIDALGISEIIGTIAGDDTIFIAVENTACQKSALKRLVGAFADKSGVA
jgi:transcriptional regulator of arginine metabolism